MSGATLTLRGFALTKGVSCVNGTLEVRRMAFSAGTQAMPWVAATNCTLRVLESQLNDSLAEGIVAEAGNSQIDGSRIERSALQGLLLGSGSHSVLRSYIHSNRAIGIDGRFVTKLVVRRSSVFANRMGGISGSSGQFDLTNNFVYRNGNAANSQFGGVRIVNSNSGNRIEHNTIAYNDSDVNAAPPMAGGIYCTGLGGPNNLVYNNFAGNNMLPNAQVNSGCDMTGSLVRNGDGTNEPHFVSPIAEPFDFHLADPASPAANVGRPSDLTEDFDGDARPNGLPDVGADELQ
ncbi:MAG: right-handed parallel beta-helix repeat-containing protein [Gemmatimonadaceae bacterium]|nr:right-handed parallel beta-helix repeat-containing protein [Gemmatimonadaceae bacterium]